MDEERSYKVGVAEETKTLENTCYAQEVVGVGRKVSITVMVVCSSYDLPRLTASSGNMLSGSANGDKVRGAGDLAESGAAWG